MKAKLFKFAAGCGKVLNRRQFLKLGALVSLAGGVPVAMANTATSRELEIRSERSLRFLHTHTGEALNVTYWTEGVYIPESLNEINRLLRDYRTNDVKPIQPALLDLLHKLQDKLDTREPFHVICGYRSPETNESLRERSHRVASHSLHMQGMAMDLRLPGRSLRQVRDAAISLKMGGVGYYSASDFVHVDVGGVRTW